jgi:hypothetical protein
METLALLYIVFVLGDSVRDGEFAKELFKTSKSRVCSKNGSNTVAVFNNLFGEIRKMQLMIFVPDIKKHSHVPMGQGILLKLRMIRSG